MSRLIALDTETTGLKSKEGDRIIEIALVEISRDPNAPHYHAYFNPEGREIAPDAIEVHGLTPDFLADKPTFAECIPDILDFIGDDATLVIHNAGFDLEFLRDEFLNCDQVWGEVPVIDTLKEAARQFPGSRHSLDALCNRFNVDTSSRTKHGALIDTRILANLYLAWFGQGGLDLDVKVAAVAKEQIVSLGAMNTLIVPTRDEAVEAANLNQWDSFFERNPI